MLVGAADLHLHEDRVEDDIEGEEAVLVELALGQLGAFASDVDEDLRLARAEVERQLAAGEAAM